MKRYGLTEQFSMSAAALENGTPSRQQWMSYQKLRTENAYTENSESCLAAKEQKFKSIALRNKTNRKKGGEHFI